MSGYQARPIKRVRRTKAALQQLCEAVCEILDEQSGPISIRRLCYIAESRGLIAKTERDFGNLGGHLTRWRRARIIRWDAFTDSTRWYYGRRLHDSFTEFLDEQVALFRFNVWKQQAAYVEIWCEKDAIASILLEAADPFRVRVFPFRGFTSLSSLYHAAEHFRALQARGKKVFVYYFGDHDPSGVLVDPAAVASLRNDFDVDVTFERVAVTVEQIATYQLPTRPTKRKGNTHAAGFRGRSVEIDAMDRDVLLRLVEDSITQHIDPGQWKRLQAVEREERSSADTFIAAWKRRRRRGPA